MRSGALRTMQICAEESGATDTVDPLAGSYYIETITHDMEARILEEMAAVDRMGGMVEAAHEVALYRFDPKVAEAQIARLERVRREREAVPVTRSLRRRRDEARGPSNLMPAMVEAVKAYATLGEISQALKDVFGEHKEPVRF